MISASNHEVLSGEPNRPAASRPVWARYGVATLAVWVAFGLCFPLESLGGYRVSLSLFVGASMVTAWYGGLGPGLAAMIAGYLLSDYFFIPPLYRFATGTPTDLALIIIYVSVTAIGLAAISALHQTQRREEKIRGLAAQLEREVQERRLTEVRLSESNERLRLALDLAQMGVFDFNPASGKLISDPQVARIFGIPNGEHFDLALGMEKIHPEDRVLVTRARERALDPASNGIFEVEYRVIWPDGSIHWSTAKGQVYFDGEGPNRCAIRMIGNYLDITERKRSEEALRHSEEQLSVIVQNASALIYLMSSDHRFVHVNRRWEELFHLKNEDVRGRLIHELFPREIADAYVANNRRVVTARAPSMFEEVARLPDGVHTYTSIKAPLFDAAGKVRGIVGVSTDITERKAMEVALRETMDQLGKVNEQLERRVKERTADLEESLKSLQGLLYHVAHDLRSPLRAMHSFTDLLLDEYAHKLDERGEDYAHRIVEASGKMDALIRDLLDYGRLGHQNISMVPVDLTELVARVLDGLELEIQNKRAEIQVDQPLPEVYGDARVLGWVVTNLITNALKFVPPGVIPHIHIWTTVTGETVSFNIQDNGIGIAPEHQERAFKVFERLHDGEDVYPGTGMGLAIVKKSMERLQGKVGVESSPGSGCRFWLELKRPVPE